MHDYGYAVGDVNDTLSHLDLDPTKLIASNRLLPIRSHLPDRALLGRLQDAEPDRFSSPAYVSACVRSSGGCSSGEASWQTSWSMLRPKLRRSTAVEYRA